MEILLRNGKDTRTYSDGLCFARTRDLVAATATSECLDWTGNGDVLDIMVHTKLDWLPHDFSPLL
jgi:hypothetical protein